MTDAWKKSWMIEKMIPTAGFYSELDYCGRCLSSTITAIYYLACINKRVDNIITTLVSCLNVGWRQLMNRLMQILVTLDDSEAVLLWNSAVHTQILTVNEVTVFATEGNAQGRTRTLSIEH